MDAKQVQSLSDSELFSILKAEGLNPGPITITTRSLYENKLNRHWKSKSNIFYI